MGWGGFDQLAVVDMHHRFRCMGDTRGSFNACLAGLQGHDSDLKNQSRFCQVWGFESVRT